MTERSLPSGELSEEGKKGIMKARDAVDAMLDQAGWNETVPGTSDVARRVLPRILSGSKFLGYEEERTAKVTLSRNEYLRNHGPAAGVPLEHSWTHALDIEQWERPPITVHFMLQDSTEHPGARPGPLAKVAEGKFSNDFKPLDDLATQNLAADMERLAATPLTPEEVTTIAAVKARFPDA